MHAPESFTTRRLRLRKPTMADAPAIFDRYAGDPTVTRFLGFPRHESLDDTVAFVDASEREWATRPSGAYLIFDEAGTLAGSTGLHIETPYRASTGYVLARDMWGHGYAAEAVGAIVQISTTLRIRRLYALCHPRNRQSVRVLQKSGFDFEGVLHRHLVFPNLSPEPQDVECWARVS